MKMNTQKIRMAVMLLLCVLLAPLSLQAQNVTIRANNGSMIASVPTGNYTDVFYKAGGFATWQHEQLAMVLTASDMRYKTSTGQLWNPANNLFSDGTHIQIAKGTNTYHTCYLSLTLPKGYRFTKYTIVVSKPGETTKSFRSGNQTYTQDFNVENASSNFGETDSTFTTYTKTVTLERGGEAKTFSRSSQSDDDMNNTLYFKFENPQSDRSIITLEHAEFEFTAEADYTPLTTPGNVQRVSAIDIPFFTSKVDYGTISSKEHDNVYRVSYSSANVKDLEANLTLYEAGAIKDGADFDGITGKIIDYKKGSISVENGYYRIGAANAENPGTEEHIYYIETPSYVVLSDNTTKNPVGYRIVGAKIDYIYGETKEYGDLHETYNTFYISYSTTGILGTTYYLNNTGGATTTQNQRALWFIDEEGYIRTGANGTTYLTNYNSQTGGSGYAGTTQNKANAIKCSIDNNGYIYYTENGTNYWLRRTTSWGSSYFRFQNNTGDRATRTMQGTTNIDITDDVIGTTTQPYTLKVYGKDGTMTGGETVTVNSSNTSGSVTLGGLNNDAVKIGVIGTGLIQGTLTLQALDPYLDQMKVVCTDPEINVTGTDGQTSHLRIERSFTASDFSVSGGKFYFHLPSACVDDEVTITFEDLKSKYFDETYGSTPAIPNGHTSRLNFVKSEHYNAFGTSNNTIYNDRSEAANAELERQEVGIVGSTKFKFNNAKDLTNNAGILTEYPFSLEKYAAAPNNGSFDDLTFTVTEEEQEDTRYVFTTDETRYNIAPTTAIQHRTYAFYEMEIHVLPAAYEPKVEFKPIYKNAIHGNGVKDNFYGAVITAPYEEDDEVKQGYASTAEIFQLIADAIKDGKDSFNHTDVPTGSDKLLYLDFSQLAGVYEITTAEHGSMDAYANTNAKNCLIFIPQGQSAPNNNVAYKTASGGFQAANSIVITDKEPFYSPYDISTVDPNYVKYIREKTTSTYNLVNTGTAGTVILPFEVLVENGQHNNTYGGSILKLHQMKDNASITTSTTDGKPWAYFPQAYEGVTATTKAYEPFLVEVVQNADTLKVGSYEIIQKGSTVYATPASTTIKVDENHSYNYLYQGETSTGTISAGTGGPDADAPGTYSFTNYGTVAGIEIPKEDAVFYFAQGRFLNSSTLAKSIKSVKVLPFRTFFTASEIRGNNPAKFSTLDIILGDGMGDEPDAIRELKQVADLGVKAGHGTLTIASKVDNNVRVNGINGVARYNIDMKAGEVKTVNVPAGIYVVNGVKIIVK